MGVDARNDLFTLEGFRDEVDGTQVESADLIFRSIEC